MFTKTDWNETIKTFDDAQKIKFDEYVRTEREKFEGHLEIYPTDANIFRCFNYFNIKDTKVVILGQDPYHGENQATGLCFDINDDCKYPPSLRNIEKVLGKKPDFESWAKQGVLLLNSSLTVLQGNAGSHIKYWLPFTKHIIDKINTTCDNVVFIVWGAFALKQTENVDTNKHTVFISSHPSPLSCNKQLKDYPSFMDSDVFNTINAINW